MELRLGEVVARKCCMFLNGESLREVFVLFESFKGINVTVV